MDHTLARKASAAPWMRILLVLVIAGLASAPISWIVDGLTPSMVVYPIVLSIGLWRQSHGEGTLYFGIAATLFLLINLPFAWAATTGADRNPADHSTLSPRSRSNG
jgi:hypothetical protein